MKSRFLAWCRWLTWGAWEFGRGIEIDNDGAVDGSGILIRIEPPGWLRAWARRRLPPPTEEEMFMRREDISDAILASLLTSPDFQRVVNSPTFRDGDSMEVVHGWAEDKLQ